MLRFFYGSSRSWSLELLWFIGAWGVVISGSRLIVGLAGIAGFGGC
jgi:hypothetical protein